MVSPRGFSLTLDPGQSVPELHRDEPPKLNVPIDSNVAVACDEVDVPYASRNADAFMYAMHVHGDVAVPDGPTLPKLGHIVVPTAIVSGLSTSKFQMVNAPIADIALRQSKPCFRTIPMTSISFRSTEP